MIRFALVFALLAQAFVAHGATSDLRALLDQVKKHRSQELAINRQREAKFKQDRDRQRQLLAEAKAELEALDVRSQELRALFDANEATLSEREGTLREQSGVLNELSGVARQMAGEVRASLKDSMISAQYPGRDEPLREFAKRKALPSLEELEDIWIAIQEEMTESGEVVRFTTEIVDADGTARQATVSRIGPFTAVADGALLNYLPETGKLAELPRQPAARYMRVVNQWEQATGAGEHRMVVDPTRGAILGLVTQTPDPAERIHQGGIVGYIILALGAVGMLFALLRYLWLSLVARKVRAQMKPEAEPRDDNPLGRMLLAPTTAMTGTREKLESVLNEAILREVPALERGNGAVKLLAAVAPMLGLLGTVTGMIAVFQAVSLFGTGDPKLMAGGISQALMTTLLGLGVAIPLLFAHSLLQSRSRALVNILDEQSAGLIARRLEQDEAT